MRPRLLEKLDQVLQKPIALISAPAGFGKTILLTQWLDRCSLPNAWLQVDENDQDLPKFLSGVVAALRQLFPGCMQKTADLLHAQGPVPLSVWTDTVIGDLEQLENTPFILAVDDYHLVSNPSIDMLLSDLLRYEPQPMHLILSARRNPSLSFTRLKVQNMVVEVRTADLRFINAEVQSFMRQAVDVPLSADVLDQLQEKTEGWAAGLALVAISLRERVQPEQLIPQLDVPDRHVSDYLLDQVFHKQPSEIQEFMLKTATFDQFCASMLSEVFEPEQSLGDIQALLERIESSQLFLVPLDSLCTCTCTCTCYRYHNLFRQMLLSHQRLYYHPDRIALYHKRAAAWLIRQGRLDDAVHHLIVVRDWYSLAQLVESQFCALLNAEDAQGIELRLAYFPEEFIATRPVLLLMQAWVAHFGLRLPVIRSLIDRIQVMLDAVLPQDESAASNTPIPGFEVIPHKIVQAHVWELNSLIYYLVNRGSQALPLARQATDALPETWLFARGNAMIYLGLSMAMEGQYGLVVEMLNQAYESLPKTRTTYGKRLLFCLAVCHLLQGELELCRQTAEMLVRNSKELNFLLILGWGYYLLGRVYQEWNQLDLAAMYYKLVIDMGFNANLHCLFESIAAYVYVLQALGRHELAQQSFDSLQVLFSEHISATAQPIMALSAWLKLQAGNHMEARRWANSFDTPIAQQAICWYHIPPFYKVKILMELNSPETCQEVDHLLDEIMELAERTHNTFTLIRALAMRAAWLSRQGKRTTAQQTLERALRLGYPGGFIQTFTEPGPIMLDLLQAISPSLKNEASLVQYVATLIDAFSSPGAPHPAPANLSPIKTLLTERELDVLKLLAERLSINEISARLTISPSTVQQHTHHIYRKLNVTKKRQAVASAELLGILAQKT